MKCYCICGTDNSDYHIWGYQDLEVSDSVSPSNAHWDGNAIGSCSNFCSNYYNKSCGAWVLGFCNGGDCYHWQAQGVLADGNGSWVGGS